MQINITKTQVGINDNAPLFSDFDETNLVSYFNVELVNVLANLLSRCRGKKINPDGIIPGFHEQEFNDKATESDKEMWRNLDHLPGNSDWYNFA